MHVELVRQTDYENARGDGDETSQRGYLDHVELNFTDFFENFNAEENFTNPHNKSNHEEVSSHNPKVKKNTKW